jgi:hypothetical protein
MALEVGLGAPQFSLSRAPFVASGALIRTFITPNVFTEQDLLYHYLRCNIIKS